MLCFLLVVLVGFRFFWVFLFCFDLVWFLVFSRQGFPGCPGAHSVDQTDLDLRDLPASAGTNKGVL